MRANKLNLMKFWLLTALCSIYLTQNYVLSSTARSKGSKTPKPYKENEAQQKIYNAKKDFHQRGIPHLRTLYEPGSLDFMRETYAEPWWNATKHHLVAFDRVDDGKRKWKRKSYEFYLYEKSARSQRNLDLYTLEMLDQVYKNRVIQTFIHAYDDPKDRIRTVDPRLISRTKCHQHLDFLLAEAERYRSYAETGDVKFSEGLDPEVAAFFDSYATDNPGSLLGNILFTGSYHECQQRQIFDMRPLEDPSPTRFDGRYCIASLKSSNWTSIIKEKQRKLEKARHWKTPDQAQQYWKALSLQVGLCLPDTCDTTIMEERKDDIRKLATLRLNYPYRGYQIEDLWCIPDDGSEHQKIDPTGWKVIYGICVWVAICIWATKCDNDSLALKKPQELTLLDRLIMCFSIKRNWRNLTETGGAPAEKKVIPAPAKPTGSDQIRTVASSPTISSSTADSLPVIPVPHPRDLSFLDFFKAGFTVLVVCGHVCTFVFQFTRNGLQQHEIANGWYNYFYNGLTYTCDYFFAMTGIITAYAVFSRGIAHKYTALQWIHMIIHRWFRLAPMFILVTWSSKTLLRHLGDGPFWDYGTTSITLRKRCMDESYFYSAFVASNTHPIHQECLVPSWYVSNDMQNYLWSPFILVGLAKFPRATWTFCITAMLACFYARYTFYMTDSRPRHIDLMRVRRDCYMRNNYDIHEVYLYSYYRFPSYLIGVLAGHYIYMVRSGQWSSWVFKVDPKEKLTTFGRYLRRFLLVAGFSMTIYQYVNLRVMDTLAQSVRDPEDIKTFIARGYTIHFANASFWITIFMVSIMLGELEKFRKFCEKPIWRIISKFNYFVLLLHMELFYFYHMNTNQMEIQSARQVWTETVLITLMAYSLSLIFTPLFEAPMGQLESLFIAPLFHGRKPSASDAKKTSKPEGVATKDDKEGKKLR